MRKVPVTINGEHHRLVGFLLLDDKISDEEVYNSTISWAVFKEEKKLVEATLLPKPSVKITNTPSSVRGPRPALIIFDEMENT